MNPEGALLLGIVDEPHDLVAQFWMAGKLIKDEQTRAPGAHDQYPVQVFGEGTERLAEGAPVIIELRYAQAKDQPEQSGDQAGNQHGSELLAHVPQGTLVGQHHGHRDDGGSGDGQPEEIVPAEHPVVLARQLEYEIDRQRYE